MKEKKQIKISLATAICMIIVEILSVVLVGVIVYCDYKKDKIQDNYKETNKVKEEVVIENNLNNIVDE